MLQISYIVFTIILFTLNLIFNIFVMAKSEGGKVSWPMFISVFIGIAVVFWGIISLILY